METFNDNKGHETLYSKNCFCTKNANIQCKGQTKKCLTHQGKFIIIMPLLAPHPLCLKGTSRWFTA